MEKPNQREIIHEHALSMVQCKVLKQLQHLEGRKFDDPDITDDIEFLNEKLHESVQDLRLLLKLCHFLSFVVKFLEINKKSNNCLILNFTTAPSVAHSMNILTKFVLVVLSGHLYIRQKDSGEKMLPD